MRKSFGLFVFGFLSIFSGHVFADGECAKEAHSQQRDTDGQVVVETVCPEPVARVLPPKPKCPDERTPIVVGFSSPSEGVVLKAYCAGSFALLYSNLPGVSEIPGFEKCKMEAVVSGAAMVGRTTCSDQEKPWDHGWIIHEGCYSLGTSPTGWGWTDEQGLEAWAAAAEVCGDTEKAAVWRERKETWLK